MSVEEKANRLSLNKDQGNPNKSIYHGKVMLPWSFKILKDGSPL